MLARFTALLLSLCIALPMCWCCVAVGQHQAKTCCAKSATLLDEHQPEHSQDKNCPCAEHEAMRDVVAIVVKAPLPELKLLAEPLWFVSVSHSILVSHFETNAARHDHGPPLVIAPAYQRHCALLL